MRRAGNQKGPPKVFHAGPFDWNKQVSLVLTAAQRAQAAIGCDYHISRTDNSYADAAIQSFRRQRPRGFDPPFRVRFPRLARALATRLAGVFGGSRCSLARPFRLGLSKS